MRTFAAAGVSAVALALIFTYVASASGGEEHMNKGEHQEHRAEMMEAVDANDFDAWVALLDNHPKAEEFATQERFNVLVEAHELREAGDIEAAHELMEEQGIKKHGMRGEHGKKGHSFDPERREALKTAMQENDFDAWSELMENHPKADEMVNMEHFELMQEAFELREAGNKEAARELLQDAGVKGSHNGMRMHAQWSK